MTSFFLLAVELLAILCSQSEVCTVVVTSYISVQLYSPHILYRQAWAEKMLFPAGQSLGQLIPAGNFPEEVLFSVVFLIARLLSTVLYIAIARFQYRKEAELHSGWLRKWKERQNILQSRQIEQKTENNYGHVLLHVVQEG